MARTISAGYVGGIALAVGDNPLTITATGSVSSTDAAALTTVGTVDWVIGNAGTISAGGVTKASVGIQMHTDATNSAGGTITNEASGVISGGQFGINSAKNVTLTNVGVITATAPLGDAVRFDKGDVANTGGTIQGARYGIYLVGAGTVANTGVITGTARAGVSVGGGSVTNLGTAATITGGNRGVFLYGSGTVTNTGSIGSTLANSYGVLFTQGGRFDNQAAGRVTGDAIGLAATGTLVTKISNAGTLSSFTHGVAVTNSLADVTNTETGVITGDLGSGVQVLGGGSVVNAGSVAGKFGIRAFNQVATVTNSGSVRSTGKSGKGSLPEAVGAGVQVFAGGTIVNEAGGRISGYWIGAQVGSFNEANPNGGAVLNAGTITANDPGVSGAAVWFKGNGTISNAATGTIGGGPFGIVTYNTVTIVNRGAISGSQVAITTSTAGTNNRIIVYPGASFSGTVLGDKAGVVAPTGVLELGAGAAAGTIAGFGTQFQSFGRVEVDAGATWSLGGTVTAGQTVALKGAGALLTLANPGAVAGVITGFDGSTGLVLGGVNDVTGTSLDGGNVLTVTRSSGTIALRFDPAQVFPPGAFGFAAGSGGTALSAPCFALGTRIATPAGEVPVEALAAGMRVLRAGGGEAEVVWVGHRRVDCTRNPRKDEVWPVRIVAGAFARGVPSRDLLLSPDHAVFVGGVLIPARHLVNGRTVRQEPADSVTYFHVELAAHDVILAEGLACESYLDTGNRGAFANGGEALMLHADFARRRWAASAFAPLVEAGAAVAAARTRLLVRAGAFGHRRSLDPGLAVMADGRALPMAAAGRRRSVALPAGAGAVAIVSRRFVPAEVEPEGVDTRRLGVGLARIALDGVALGDGDARLAGGWYPAEDGGRWTDGHGWVHAGGAAALSFEVVMAGQYWDDSEGVKSKRAAGKW